MRGACGEIGSYADRSAAAFDAGNLVTYQSPQYRFSGNNLCGSTAGLTSIVTELTPGDLPLWSVPVPGPNFGIGISQQSVHPNSDGTTMYAVAADAALRSTRVNLAATIVGGASTMYYSTARLHQAGPATLNVSSFSACDEELRVGMRRGNTQSTVPYGTQDTDTLSWTSPHGVQTFTTSASPHTTELPTGWYALNARLVTSCPGDGNQPWTAELYW